MGTASKKYHKDRLKGGKADKSKPSDFDPKQLRKGIKHEMEHTNSKAIAREIAMDHLKEDDEYYDHLEEMERHEKKEKKAEKSKKSSKKSRKGK